jgi:hypothetical protein
MSLIQRRLNQIVREEFLHLSRKYPARFGNVEEASACLMQHLTAVARPSPRSPREGGSSSGEESDGERERRVAHLRSVYGLTAGDAERVTLLGDELRRQNARLRREAAAAAAAAGAWALAAVGEGGGGGGGSSGSGSGGGGGGGDSPALGPEAGATSEAAAAADAPGGSECKRSRREGGSAGAEGAVAAAVAVVAGPAGGCGGASAAAAAAAAAALPAAPPPPPRLPLRRPFPGAEAAEMAMLASVERLSEKLRLMRPLRGGGGGSGGGGHHHHHHHHHLQHQQHQHVLQHQQHQHHPQQRTGSRGEEARRGVKRGKAEGAGAVEVLQQQDATSDGEDSVRKRLRKL